MVKNNIRHHYPDIERGCTLTIPITVKDENDDPIDLTPYMALFTIKDRPFDFDRSDEFTFVSKQFNLGATVAGTFYISLSSKDLDFAPGQYFFDIVLIHKVQKVSTRIICCDFNLVGGPSNKQVSLTANQTLMGAEGININFVSGRPFIVYSPSLTGAQIADFERRISELEAKI